MGKKSQKKLKNNKKTKKNMNLLNLVNFESIFNNLKVNYKKSNKSEKDKIKLEELSTQLLLKMDSIEINGNQDLRIYRKSIINSINTYIDNLK